MKTEKEILCEFVGLVFRADDNDVLSAKHLLKSSLTSVRIVANEAIEISSHLNESDRGKLNAKMIEAGLPPLTSLQDKAFRDFLKIANRGNIKNDGEFYLVKSVLGSSLLNKDHQRLAFKLIDNYE